MLGWDFLKSKNQPILQLAQYKQKVKKIWCWNTKLMGASTMALQKFLCISYTKYFIYKDTTIKKFARGILIYLNSPIIQHWFVLHQISHIFPIFLLNFGKVGSIKWKATNVLWTLEVEEQCVKIQPPLSSYMFIHQPIYLIGTKFQT